MYAPIKAYLESEGYVVRGEVKSADIVAVKEDKLIVIEMKTSFNLKLVYQLIERQRITDQVYAAVAVTYKTRRSKAFKNMEKLLKRLSVGLIIIYIKKDGNVVEKLFDPKFNRYNRSHKKEKSMKDEFESRSHDYNTGGVTGEKIITVYRETAIKIACLLENEKGMTLKKIRMVLEDDSVNKILQKNYYGWFERVSRGMYKLDNDALNEIKEFDEIYEKYRNMTSFKKNP